MTDNRNIRLGMVGCGRVTETRHLPALQRVMGVEVVALSDVDVDRLNQVANFFHVKDRYLDYQRLLNDRSIDAVAVCVPAQFHVKIGLTAMDAGKHVFIEKPLALNLDESDLLIRRARETSKKVMVGFNLRWHRLIREARMIIDQGGLGAHQMIRTVLSGYHEDVPQWRRRRVSGGGVVFEQAVHHFDLWRYLLRSEIEEVFAISRSAKWDDETATVMARLSNGVLASSVFSQVTKACNQVEIYGDVRSLHDGIEHASSLGEPGGIKNRIEGMGRTLRALPSGLSAIRYGGDFVDSYRAEWRHFIDAIRNETPTESTLEDGRSALEAALAVVASISTGRAVKISATRGTIE
jgi:myo-inositol 2-dehydrogenase / D-chiro-inositol 1-dehydrogenase